MKLFLFIIGPVGSELRKLINSFPWIELLMFIHVAVIEVDLISV